LRVIFDPFGGELDPPRISLMAHKDRLAYALLMSSISARPFLASGMKSTTGAIV